MSDLEKEAKAFQRDKQVN